MTSQDFVPDVACGSGPVASGVRGTAGRGEPDGEAGEPRPVAPEWLRAELLAERYGSVVREWRHAEKAAEKRIREIEEAE